MKRWITVEHDRERRLRLSRVIAPASATALLAFFVASLANPDLTGARDHLGLVLLCGSLFLLATAASWRGRLTLATSSILVGAFLVAILIVVTNQPITFSSLLTLPAALVIGLAALLGAPRMTFAAAACTSALVVVLAGEPSLQYALSDRANVASVVAVVVEQWVLAAIVYALARGSQRVLGEQVEMAAQMPAEQSAAPILTGPANEPVPPAESDGPPSAAGVSNPPDAFGSESLPEVLPPEQLAQTAAPELVPLGEALVAAAASIEPPDDQSGERPLQVSIPAGLAIWGERAGLQEILASLLANAVAYSPAGTSIEVSARRVEERAPAVPDSAPRGELVEIAVRDYGRGFPADQLPTLFDPGPQPPTGGAPSAATQPRGLQRAWLLAQAMGGSIQVESAGVEGEGTTVSLRLPLSPPETDVTLPDEDHASVEPVEDSARQHEDAPAAAEVASPVGG